MAFNLYCNGTLKVSEIMEAEEDQLKESVSIIP